MNPAILESNKQMRINIKDRVLKSSKLISPVWPLQTIIACNPLMNLDDMNFWEAIDLAKKKFFSLRE